jgi:hypothetical protein
VYALLFADSGLSTAQITSLLIIWSVVPVVLEVPSGAIADLVPRRALLTAAALIRGAGFALWVIAPCYASFAVGFVLWGGGSALESGTYESYVYDRLHAAGAVERYRTVIAGGRSGGLLLNLAATVLAAPLLAISGFGLVGAVSVAACGVQGALGATLPPDPRRQDPSRSDPSRSDPQRSDPQRSDPSPAALAPNSIDPTDRPDTVCPARHATDPGTGAGTADSGVEAGGVLAMLRAGLAEATRISAVRRALALAVLLPVFGVLDEYFGLLARDLHTSTDTVPLLVASTVAAQAAGAFTARRCPAGMVGPAVVAAGLLVASGALLGTPIGFLGVAAGYGLFEMTVVVVQTRLQDAITGPARATVTSVAGMMLDTLTIVLLGAIALGSTVLSLVGIVVGLAAAMLPVGILAARWVRPGAASDPGRRAPSRAWLSRPGR